MEPISGPISEPISIHFHGPLSFTPGERSLFHSPLALAACVYLWTIRSEKDGHYYIHYVGETVSFAWRHKQHLIHTLSMNYGIYDPAAARRGIHSAVFQGLWRDKTPEGPARLLEKYATSTKAVLDYVAALEIFVAPTTVPTNLRKHVEGSIGWHLRNNHKDKKILYADDNHIGMGAKVGRQLLISSDCPIAGVDPVLDI